MKERDLIEPPMPAHEIAEHAGKFVRSALATSGLSELQLIAVFRVAASVCDEMVGAQQRAYMMGRLLGLR